MNSPPQTSGSGSAASGPSSDPRDDTPFTSEETPLLAGSSSSSAVRLGTQKDSNSRHVETQSKVHIPLARAIAIGVSLWLLIFLTACNMSGMTLIQGAIASQLGSHGSSAMWFTSAYLIPMSSLAPVAGRLATIFPPRTLILPIAALIATGGLICALSASFGTFVAGRVIAGTGGAGVLSLAIIIGLELASEKSRGLVLGLINAGFTAGVSFGAIVFGGLMPVVGWIPFAFATGLGVFISIPAAAEAHDTKTSTREKLARIDYLGAGLLTTSIVLFLYAIADEIETVPLCIAPVILLLFLAVENYLVADPIIPVKVLSSWGILFSCFAQLGLMIARWSVLFYAPIFMLAVRGSSPAAAGSILIPTNVGFGLGGILVGWLHVRRDGAFWLPSISALAIFTVSTYVLSLISTTSLPLALFIVVVLINGLATGGGVNYTLAHILHLSHDDTRYIATSLLGTFRGSGSSFGTAVAGGIFYRLLRGNLVSGFLQLDGGEHLSHARQRLISSLVNTPGLVHGGDLSPAEQNIATEGYAGATRGVWQAMATLGGVVVLFQALTGKKAPEDRREDEQPDEEAARAVVAENEGVGEA
ncbi:vacuolar basic amino acid transporter 1 [Fusarium tjaetaba]|uniref:Vacuolar basic amino acid transporter 1 n=1 Tax=Fusarium tjaetaba TaxID=1567544 RepID=A0A8H5VRJ6_9HYPO|nr:vacuolar basic amino acid transporter 1 [Fusarium tjaetaba]KAF5630619.1 vacuolar basic amino acid transporter 1 [Fusarium tjaetaba]